ncbi:hypothetical protein [Sphaerisporangium flaviroseum]|uniref:hypothetical protein n=1 Tax=Sphaerisporangium flaviroseum TaxID=509199 RepID=UPI0031EA62DC
MPTRSPVTGLSVQRSPSSRNPAARGAVGPSAVAADALQPLAVAAGGGGESAAQRVAGPAALEFGGRHDAGHAVGDGLGGHPAVRVTDRAPAPSERRGHTAVPVDAHQQRPGAATGLLHGGPQVAHRAHRAGGRDAAVGDGDLGELLDLPPVHGDQQTVRGSATWPMSSAASSLTRAAQA